MAKFLDFSGLTHTIDKIKEWANKVFIPASQKGAPNGLASLDGTGKVPAAQLPSYVDDVLEGYMHTDGKFYKEETHVTVITGESGKIYVDLKTGKTNRWSGTAFAEISESLALGETASTAFPGDKGKEAYDHSKKTSGNPHGVTKTDVGLGNLTNDKQMKGLASGATEGHVIAFGADGYTPKDTGFTIGMSIPKPQSADMTKFLRGDGTWGTVEQVEVDAITNEEIDDLFK